MSCQECGTYPHEDWCESHPLKVLRSENERLRDSIEIYRSLALAAREALKYLKTLPVTEQSSQVVSEMEAAIRYLPIE